MKGDLDNSKIYIATDNLSQQKSNAEAYALIDACIHNYHLYIHVGYN